jgi:hypothetical protein
VTGQSSNYPSAIVYGPKAALAITAPAGWVIDDRVGVEHDLPCVLYRKSDTWENADPLMYAKIASTSVEDAGAFARASIARMKKERGDFNVQRVESGQTGDGRAWFVNEYWPTSAYSQHERVAYIQLPGAVAYVVYSASSEGAFRKNQSSLPELVMSLTCLEPMRN